MAKLVLLRLGICHASFLNEQAAILPACSRKLKWYALCPVVDALNHSSFVEVSSSPCWCWGLGIRELISSPCFG